MQANADGKRRNERRTTVTRTAGRCPVFTLRELNPQRRPPLELHVASLLPLSLDDRVGALLPLSLDDRVGALLPLSLDDRVGAGPLDLPFVPASTSQLLALCARDDVETAALARAIGSDPTLAAHFLRLSNTAVFAARTRIVSLRHAVARLGTTLVRQLALLISCHSRAFHVRGHEAMARTLRDHSITTAFFAQELARQRGDCGEEAFLYGLLHDIGAPAVLQLIGDFEVQMGETCDDETVAREVHRLHESVGFSIASVWSTSPVVCGVTASHHRAPCPHDRSPTALAVATLQIAEALADGVPYESLGAHPAVALLGFNVEDLERAEGARTIAAEIVDSLG